MTTTDPAERLDPLRRENIVAALTESGVMEEWEAENGRGAIVRSLREHGITLAPLDYQISAREALAAAYQRGRDEERERVVPVLRRLVKAITAEIDTGPLVHTPGVKEQWAVREVVEEALAILDAQADR